MRLPWVSRKVFERLQKERDAIALMKINSLKDDLKEAEEFNRDILPRLLNITVTKDYDFNRYRICIDFHRDMVERAFTHGGDDHAIRHLAYRLSKEVERKMVPYNFARCDYEN